MKGIAPGAMPWARSVESRFADISASLKRLGVSSPDTDKAVFSEFSTGQNLELGFSGKALPTAPVAVRYVSSTGIFEVTVSLAGLVRDGAILGAGFESLDVPYQVDFDLPLYGVVQQAPVGPTAWKPFSASYSTVLSTRPGVQDLSLYLYGVCTAGVASAAYVKRCRLSVKAV
jgi:hypothetical protein